MTGEAPTRRQDGAFLALFADKWQLNGFLRSNPDERLETLIATAD